MDKLSKDERELVIKLGYREDLRLIDQGFWNFIDFLDVRAADLFCENRQGPEVDAMRRALSLIKKGKFRDTPEYQEAIKIVDQPAESAILTS